MKNIHIGNALKNIIEEKGLKKTSIADKLGIVENYIHRIFKKNHIDTKLLYSFLEILEMTGVEFFSLVEGIPAPTYAKEENDFMRIVEEPQKNFNASGVSLKDYETIKSQNTLMKDKILILQNELIECLKKLNS